MTASNRRKRPPMQPIVMVGDVVRFQPNAIVRWLLDNQRIDLNEIAVHLKTFPVSDREQFWQLLGYSVSGYGDLSFVRRKTIDRADAKAAKVLAAHKAQGQQ